MLEPQRRAMSRFPPEIAIVCFSHLRWDFVFQRPQHVMARFAREHPVFFIEEPLPAISPQNNLYEYELTSEGVHRVVPLTRDRMHDVIDDVLGRFEVERFVSWYYTPAALSFTGHLDAEAVVYDCMDQLSAFKGADPRLTTLEFQLLAAADVVYAGGRSLYESKRSRHSNIHLLPSSVDQEHFRKGRNNKLERMEHAKISRPRAGYYGVIDERLDLDLLESVALRRSDWSFVMVGPVVKIDPEELPRVRNIHYIGQQPYEALPSFLAGWDVAIQPFARNAATRYISPTKTLEYLAAGKRVVSTSIRDVVDPYGNAGVVEIADDPYSFGKALDVARSGKDDAAWNAAVEAILQRTSWDRTWEAMDGAIAQIVG